MSDNPLDNLPEDDSKPVKLELSKEQQLIVLKEWQARFDNPPAIEELLKLVWPDKKLTLNHREARLIKQFLVEKELKFPDKIPKELKELTDEQRQFIENNLNMSDREVAQVLFDKPFLPPMSREARLIRKYKEELRKQGLSLKPLDEEEETAEEYRPPSNVERCCVRINKCVQGAKFDNKNLTPTQKKQVYAALNHLNSDRFIHHMNLIANSDDRKLFEHVYLKYVYDKPDLSQEDLDQYVILANESVMESSIKRTIAMLEAEQQRSLDETGKLQMTIVDSIKVSRDEYNACIKRQQSLFKALTEERSKRLQERIGPQFTLLNMVDAMKNEERRRQIVQEAEKRNDKLKGEIQRLSEMDRIVGSFWGLDSDLVING